VPSLIVGEAPRRSTLSLDVMYRRVFLMSLLTSCAGCVPIKSTYYEAIDKSRVAAATDGNLLACPSLKGYGLGTAGASMWVNAYSDSGRARIELLAYISNPHQLTFETFELQLISLSEPTNRSSVPLVFYRYCKGLESARDCPRENPEDRTLSEPVGSNPFPAQFQFIGIAFVPPQLVDGFQVTLPDIFDRAARVDARPLRFQRHSGALLTGLGGCE
jgi:hypothetical protein